MMEGLIIRRANQEDVEPMSDIWWEYMLFHQEIDRRLRPDPNGKEEGNRRCYVDGDEGWLREGGIGSIRLNFARGNTIARSFWKKKGSEEIFVVSEKKI